jgi:hypothetical protein
MIYMLGKCKVRTLELDSFFGISMRLIFRPEAGVPLCCRFINELFPDLLSPNK